MSRLPDDDGPPLSARDKKGLTYTQETPSFLRRLHAQVRGTHFEDTARRERTRGNDTDDPLLEWMAPDARRADQGRSRERDEYHSDDDLAHAQVVVLKEGKHLTKEDYNRERSLAPNADPSAPHTERTTQPVAEAGGAAHQRKSASRIAGPRHSKTVMHDAKKWIHEKRNELRESTPKASKKKRARPPGAGLSFSVDEE